MHIRDVLQDNLEPTYWVRAEISEGRQNASGHYYCNFIEKNAFGQDIASIKGIIWADTFRKICPRFESETGQKLAAGIKVLVRVRVNFHERYGMSLVVIDIDSSYTIGDMAKRRLEILKRLEADGVKDMNKELALPRPLLRIAVVSSATAAGYGDFCNHLENSDIHYNFVTKLFPAIMQGDKVAESVISALDKISAEADKWDAVAILRGGGAVSDLNGFESYELASNVANFPLPVITGIGHERDETVVDLVANTRCKTPTAVADFLLKTAESEYLAIDDLRKRLQRASANVLSVKKQTLMYVVSRTKASAAAVISREKRNLAVAMSKARMASSIVKSDRQRFDSVCARIAPAVSHVCLMSRNEFESLLQRLPKAVRHVSESEESKLERMVTDIKYGTRSKVSDEKKRVAECVSGLITSSRLVVILQHRQLSEDLPRLSRASVNIIKWHKNRLDSYEKNIRFAGPERAFQMGFSLTMAGGKVVTDAAQLKEGDVITTRFKNGTADSRVMSTETN